MKNKIEIVFVVLTLLASVACGGSFGGQSTSQGSSANPSGSAPGNQQNQVGVSDLSATMAPIKSMGTVVGSYALLSTDNNNHLKGLAEVSNKAWSEFEDILSQIQSGKSVSISTPELIDKYEISSVTVDQRALDMWLKAFNDAQKITAKSIFTPEKSVADNGVIDVSTMAITCNKVSDFSKIVDDINKTSGAACMLALADVVPGDELPACGMFALNKSGEKAAVLMELSCNVLPLTPKVLKVYFGKPCLKTISDINPTADQTSVETRAIFNNNLDKSYVLKLLIGEGIKRVSDSMSFGLLPQTFIDAATGDLSKNISELLVKTGSAFGLNLDTSIDAINGDGPVDPKYIKWTISNPIVEIKDKIVKGASERGTTYVIAELMNWPNELKTAVKSLNVPYLVSAPPKLISFAAGPDVAQCSSKNFSIKKKVATFEIEDDDLDLLIVNIDNTDVDRLSYFSDSAGESFKQKSAIIRGYVVMPADKETAGSANIKIGLSDLCGNTVSINGNYISWLASSTYGMSDPCFDIDKVSIGMLMEETVEIVSGITCDIDGVYWEYKVKSCESKYDNQPTDECYAWTWDKICKQW